MNLDIVYRKLLINLCVCVQISDSQELTAFSAYFFSCPDRTSFFLENPSLFSQNYDSTFSGPMAEKWHWHTEGDNHSDRHQWLTLRWSCGLAGSCEVLILTSHFWCPGYRGLESMNYTCWEKQWKGTVMRKGVLAVWFLSLTYISRCYIFNPTN